MLLLFTQPLQHHILLGLEIVWLPSNSTVAIYTMDQIGGNLEELQGEESGHMGSTSVEEQKITVGHRHKKKEMEVRKKRRQCTLS